MKFRPCIDLHQGQVKQIVGSTLTDTAASKENETTVSLQTNFETTVPAAEFAQRYAADQLLGGHVIMLGSTPENYKAAMSAIQAYPGGLQVGGGITNDNALEWITAGASHVIVTSHVFTQGQIHYDRLRTLRDTVTKERLVLDLSCRKKPKQQQQNASTNDTTTSNDVDHDDTYYVVTDRWQKFTNYPVNATTLQELAQYCDEFLVHGVDVEGKQCGILPDLVELLGHHAPIPVTYAGGVRSLADMELVDQLGRGRVDCTIGSALDIFGGSLSYNDVVQWHYKHNPRRPRRDESHNNTSDTTTTTTTATQDKDDDDDREVVE